MVETPVPPVMVLDAGAWPRRAAKPYERAAKVSNKAEMAWRLAWPTPTPNHMRIQKLISPIVDW